jgi:hypothetical protein
MSLRPQRALFRRLIGGRQSTSRHSSCFNSGFLLLPLSYFEVRDAVWDLHSPMGRDGRLRSESEANILFFLGDLSNRNRQLMWSIRFEQVAGRPARSWPPAARVKGIRDGCGCGGAPRSSARILCVDAGLDCESSEPFFVPAYVCTCDALGVVFLLDRL